jgi:hypothetical protein
MHITYKEMRVFITRTSLQKRQLPDINAQQNVSTDLFLPDIVPHMSDTNKTLRNGVYFPILRLIFGA